MSSLEKCLFSVDLICSLYSWSEVLGLLPLSHCPWVSIMVLFPTLLGFAPEADLEDLGLPQGCQVWRSCSCLDRWTSDSTRYPGELTAKTAGNIVL